MKYTKFGTCLICCKAPCQCPKKKRMQWCLPELVYIGKRNGTELSYYEAIKLSVYPDEVKDE